MVNEKLISIAEHNNNAMAKYETSLINKEATNIACPDCGEPLYIINPNITLLTYPPKVSVVCHNCHYNGTIIK